MIAQNRYLKAGFSYPIDYIKVESAQTTASKAIAEKIKQKALRRNLFKNVIMRIVI